MKVFLGLGKVLAVLFWLALAINFFTPFAYPFALGLWLVGGAIALLHLVELVLMQGRLLGRSRPWLDHVQGLVFGMFHLYALPQPRAKGVRHA
ncbi:MAG: DUF1145 domain-containing protein [Pseudomonadota bacterium]